MAAKRVAIRKTRSASSSRSTSASRASGQRRAARQASSSSSLSLPTKPNEPPTNLFDYGLFIYGEKGIGKTSLAAQFPDALVFQWEPRRRNVRVLQVPEPGQDELNWESFLQYQELALGEKKIKTIVIDTIDRAYDACLDYVCQSRGVTHPNELNDYGQTWALVKKEFEDAMNRFLFSDKAVVWISHARYRVVPGRLGVEVEQLVPTCKPAAWAYVRAVCDFAFAYTWFEYQRVLYVRGGELIWTGCGTNEHFLQPSKKGVERPGEPYNAIPMGNSPQESYKNLLNAFQNKVEGLFLEDIVGG